MLEVEVKEASRSPPLTFLVMTDGNCSQASRSSPASRRRQLVMTDGNGSQVMIELDTRHSLCPLRRLAVILERILGRHLVVTIIEIQELPQHHRSRAIKDRIEGCRKQELT